MLTETTKRSRWTYILIGVFIGSILSFCLAWVSFIYFIHDGFRVAAYLFPHAVLLSPDFDALSLTSLTVAFILWPVYGAILGGSVSSGRRRWQVIAVCLLIEHIALGSIAWKRVDSQPVKITVGEKNRN